MNIKRLVALTLALTGILAMLASCKGGSSKPLLPNVSGKAGEVIVVMNKDDWDGNIATSQVVMAPVSFFKELFLARREEINDSKCRHFEHVLYDSIQDWTKKNGHH